MTTVEPQSLVLKALEEAGSIGMAPRQIGIKVGLPTQEVQVLLDRTKEKGTASMIGRNLWILSKNADIGLQFGFKTSDSYLKEFERQFKTKLVRYGGKITFTENGDKRIHGWSPCVQGFSSSFVSQFLKQFGLGKESWVADQYVGSGTVAVCAKMKGINSIGLDLNPLMTFMAKSKLAWETDIEHLFDSGIELLARVRDTEPSKDLPFLTETERQFDPPILKNLLKMRAALSKLPEGKTTRMLWFAFGSILVDSSRLWRAPGLGYTTKHLPPNAPQIFFSAKLKQMVEDLHYVQAFRERWGETKILTADARTYEFEPNSMDASIQSPPYSNGIDYVINYKIEAAWLNILNSYEDMAKLRDKMVVCDNVSRGVIEEFRSEKGRVEDEWLTEIVATIGANLERKKIARRPDMHQVIRKYFEDLYPSLEQVHRGLKKKAPLVMVLGDSLISGVYIPTDMIVARMAKKVGFRLQAFELARRRRSGQWRDFILRETILVLAKENSA
ncbi:MAG TPA: hypothetical protein VGS11_10735 [Candidatus Bathyarchaeia archaeon]|nr:hypothetical protein [Candidatus Bathyarchaeia archaeon]